MGKWHLGVGRGGVYLPTRHGFDSYLGVPYSHDMCPCETCFPLGEPCHDSCREDEVSCPLFDDLKVAEQPVDLLGLTEKYTERVVEVMEKAKMEERPFFVYLAYHQPHHPQFSSKELGSVARKDV